MVEYPPWKCPKCNELVSLFDDNHIGEQEAVNKEPHCPVCGYTKQDVELHLDHYLCSGTIPDKEAKDE